MNTTYALNMLIKGILKRGDHVLISDMEHNSVFRPIYRLADEGLIEYDVFSTEGLRKNASPKVLCEEISRLLRPNTRLLVCTHASNICSLMLPLREIGALCQKNGILFAVDAAQSAGHVNISMRELGITPDQFEALANVITRDGALTVGVNPELKNEDLIRIFQLSDAE